MTAIKEHWYEVIDKRHSRRAFDGRQLTGDVLEKMKLICSEFQPFAGIKGAIINNPLDEIFRGIVGSYGKVKGVPAYVALIGTEDETLSAPKAGYTGEGIVLEATSLGLDSCWVGGLFSRRLVAKHLKLDRHEKIWAVVALGYALNEKRLDERTLTFLIRSHKRKALKEIAELHGDYPDWYITALEAACKAPSARNRQPWYFRWDGEGVEVSIDSPQSVKAHPKGLDCGIAMLHLELGALHAGVKGRWEFLRLPRVAKFTPAGSN